MLQGSRGSSYYSMVITSGCFLCCSPCIAGSFPSCVSGWELCLSVLPEKSCFWKGEQGARADSVLGFCTTKAIQVNLRCRKEGCSEVPSIQDLRRKKATCLSFPRSWAIVSRKFASIVFIPSLRHTLLVTVRNTVLSEYMGFSFDLIQPPFVSLPAPEV